MNLKMKQTLLYPLLALNTIASAVGINMLNKSNDKIGGMEQAIKTEKAEFSQDPVLVEHGEAASKITVEETDNGRAFYLDKGNDFEKLNMDDPKAEQMVQDYYAVESVKEAQAAVIKPMEDALSQEEGKRMLGVIAGGVVLLGVFGATGQLITADSRKKALAAKNTQQLAM